MEYTNSNVDSEISALTNNDCHNIPGEKPLSPILNSAGLGASRRNLIKKRTKLKKTRVNLCERFRKEILSNQSPEIENIALLKNSSLVLDQLSEINSIDELAEVDRARKKFYNLITANTDRDFCFKMPSPVPKPKKVMQQMESSTNITNSLDLEDIVQENICLHLNSATIQSNKIGFQTAGGHKVEIPDGQLEKQMHLFDDILLRRQTTGKRDNKYNFLRKPNNLNNCITKTADLKLSKSFNISHHMPDISDTQLVTEAEKIMLHNNLDNITRIPKSEQFYGFHYDEITKSYEMHRNFVKSYQDFLKGQTQEKSQCIDNINYRKRQLDDIAAPESKRIRTEFDMDDKEKYSSNNGILNNISRGFSTASGKLLAISQKSLEKANKIFEEISSDLDPIKNRNETDSLLKVASLKDKNSSTGITYSTSSRKCIDVSENSLIHSNKISKEISSHQCHKIRYSSTGFSTASEKPINVSEKALKMADNIFNELNNESSSNTLIAIDNGFSKASKKILDGSENSLQAQNEISENFDISSLGQPDKIEKHSNIITKDSKEINPLRFDKNGFISTGFSTASKKPINVSESSLKKADNILKEINAESSSDNLTTNKNNTFSNAPKKIGNVSENSLQAESDVFKHSSISSLDQPAKIENHSRTETRSSSDNGLSRCNIPKGFSTGSGKIINISENSLRKARTIFDDINTELSVFKSEPSTYKHQSSLSEIPSNQSMNKISRGFSSVSGKPINISSSALAKANNIFETISSNMKNEQLLVRDENTNANVSNTSKNSYITSEISANSNDTSAAPGISNILEATVMTMNNILGESTELVNQNATNSSESVPETIAQRVSRNKLELLDAAIRRIERLNGDDYSDREDLLRKEAIKKMGRIKAVSSPVKPGLVKSSNSGSAFKLLPTISSKSSKRKLGISTCQQIQISEEKLQRAKMLFSEEFPDLSPIKPSVRANFPSHSFGVNSSTPIARRSVLMPMEKTAVDSNTPRKASPKTATNEFPTVVHKNDLSIVITEPTRSTVSEWSENITEECKMLERKLNVLKLRNEQLCLKKEKTENEKRPKEGVLHMKKNLKDKIILRSLTLKENPEVGKIALITSQNAEQIHFRELSPFLVTEDGATIIPNSEDLIGLSEIEHGFKLMPGIDPALIPNGWIRNHFKWIIWKIASYEKNLADQLAGSLIVENVVQQLKYRYDREIDKAERSALRRIYEKDDAPQKRMILCVSNIILSKLELELTDGWYSIRTVVDVPLQNQISSGKITIGTKVITSGAELVNCDGCNPLEATDMIYLKINYNCTRRALWYTKLGYQTFSGPFPIRIESVHPAGGPIGLLKLLVVRSYPIKYLERLPNQTTVWRNIKAEERAAQHWENEQCKQMEKLQDDASDKMDKISDKSGKDSESCRQELMSCVQESIQKLMNRKRNVSSVLRLLVVDTLSESLRVHNLSIWSPSESHLQNLKEGAAFTVSNILPRANGDLCTGSKTMFTAISLTKTVPSCFERKSILIDELNECKFRQNFQEFDCVGLVLKIIVESNNQLLWLCGTKRRLLMVRILEGPDKCSLFDNLRRGTIVTACNLVYKKRKDYINEAIANHNSVFSYYPQYKHLQTAFEEFKTCCPKDLDPLYKDCDDKIANYEQRSLKSAKCDSLTCYDSDEDTLSMSCLTSTDVALSLIDMDKFM